MCWNDVNGSGTIANEPLTDHITPDTNFLIMTRNDSRARNGDIFLISEEDRPRVSSYVLGTTAIRDQGDVFSRYVKDPHHDPNNDTVNGYMQSESPFPDPDTSFRSLEQDPLLVGLPEGLRSAVDPASQLPPSNESCGPMPNKCLVAVASADVFYFGPDPTNTACLSAITSPPPNPTPPRVAMDPSSVYVVYHSPQIFNECREMVVGIGGPPVTMSYQSNMMSTLEYRSDATPATKALDFADLPCPPTEVAEVYNSGTAYSPILHSTFGAEWKPGLGVGDMVRIAVCEIAAIRDPPIHAHRVGKISGAKDGSGGIP